jgi:cytochrome c-type biogenesis protein
VAPTISDDYYGDGASLLHGQYGALGHEAFRAQDMLDIVFALIAGVLTIAAPCVLPMLPLLLGVSVGQTSRTRPLFITLGFILSFATFAFVFGVFSDLLGLSADTLRDAAVVLLLIFGLLMVWPRPFEWLSMQLNPLVDRFGGAASRAGSGNMGGFVLGLTLGVVWTPCAGPVLGSILTLIATSQRLPHAALLLLVYAIGAGIPMLGIAYGGQYATTHIRRFARYAHRVQQGFGIAVISIAIAIYFQYDSLITVWLSQFYPNGQVGF